MLFLEIEDREHILQQFPAMRRGGQVTISFQFCHDCRLPRDAIFPLADVAPRYL
jgi:hypothetical protein